MHHPRRYRMQGFTLIELLVSIFIMSLLALISWRGIDGMARAQEVSQERADYVATMQTALAQWNTDLDQAFKMPQFNAIDFDCSMLRITRRYSDTDLRVIGWAKRGLGEQTRWLRWQSAPVNNRLELDRAWAAAGRWGLNPSDAERKLETEIASIDDWQIFYYRNNAWSNPCSAAGTQATAGVQTPDGIRLILKLSQGQALAGTLTRDWVRPDFK
jgi:general secretion pathway protein J